MSLVSKYSEVLRSNEKWKVFGLILVAIILVGTVFSLVARMTFLRDNPSSRPRLAVVAPKDSAAAKSLRQGAAIYLERLNHQGGYKGRQVEILDVDEGPGAAEKVLADTRVVGVVGHLDEQQLKVAAASYAAKKLPIVTTSSPATQLPGVTSIGLSPGDQARFLANYTRNIQLRRILYVIREAGAGYDQLVDPFVDVYRKFDTPVRAVWTVPKENPEAAIKGILEEVRKLDIGAIYIAASPQVGAQLVKGIRETGNAIDIVGTSSLAGNEFIQKLSSISGKDTALQSHGITATTPVLFDTANEDAQRFQTSYQQRFKETPDWLATCAFDAAAVVFSSKPGTDEVKGITGRISFVDGRAQLPVQVGIFNGERLISAPVQLLPIAKGASFNYIEALRNGRVLYVNDRFMFKSNVVYVGITVHEVSELDIQKEVATLDMSIWFRYRGSFSPQEMQIDNAVEPVKFEKPVEEKESDEVQYRRYRIKQKFKLNFTDAKRAYGQHVAGLTFRHRLLNRNNLSYVVDILGMPTGNALVEDLRKRKIVKSSTGWGIDTAWMSQDVVRELGDGAPQYVGMTGEQPFFSTITMGVMLKPASIQARDIISGEYLVYLAIFGILGSLAALYVQNTKKGQFFMLHSWLLRLIFWPILLVASGNSILDWAFSNLSPSGIRNSVIVYESLWWLMAGRLAEMAIHRFVWASLEEKAQRKIPNVMKFFVTILLYALTAAGITAFVFDKTLTSMLATSGVLAMVIGLAIQSNIANVFSGIILNIERPFKVGDYIKINNLIGQVRDITWRTIRIESNDGQTLIMANSKVSEAFMENYSEVPNGIAAETVLHVNPDADPKKVLDIITDAVADNKAIILKDDPLYAPMVRYKGIVNVNGYWVAEYAAGYRVKILPKKSQAKELIWTFVRRRFMEEGIPMVPAAGEPPQSTGAIAASQGKPV